MSLKDLFRVILKLFGLYLAFLMLVLLPNVLMSFSYGLDFSFLGTTLIPLLTFGVLSYVLITQTDGIIDFFKIEKGFDSDRVAAKQFTPESTIRLGLVVISVYFIISSLPDILTNAYYAFKNSIPQDGINGVLNAYSVTQPDYYLLITASMQFLLALLLMMNKNVVAARIEKMNKPVAGVKDSID